MRADFRQKGKKWRRILKELRLTSLRIMKLVITNNVHFPKPRKMRTRDAGLRTSFAYAGVAEAMRSTVGFGASRSANVADHGWE